MNINIGSAISKSTPKTQESSANFDFVVNKLDTSPVIPNHFDRVFNFSLITTPILYLLSQIVCVDINLWDTLTLSEIFERMPIDFWESYKVFLFSEPFKAKSIASGTVYALGDIIVQLSNDKDLGNLDRPRVLRAGAFGAIIHGPMRHMWYIWLDEQFLQAQIVGQWAWVPKVIIDDLGMTPPSVAGYIAWNGGLQNKKWPQIVEEIKEKMGPTSIAGIKLWVPADSITYAVIPLEYRLLWVDAVEVIWCMILANGGEKEKQKLN